MTAGFYGVFGGVALYVLGVDVSFFCAGEDVYDSSERSGGLELREQVLNEARAAVICDG